MCEFCTKHGDGKKWYLQARNYSEELENDVRRQRVERKWLEYMNTRMADGYRQLEEQFPRAPRFVQRIISSLASRRHKREHMGQVVPIEDLERIFGIVNSVVRLPCVCRRATVGRDVNYCMGISILPEMGSHWSYEDGPYTRGMDRLSREEAIQFVRELEKDGLVHSIWTFGTPFIGGVCNCDRRDCIAMLSRVKHNMQIMFKAEYVASVDRDLCTGCRSCMRLCQFGAMGFGAADRKAVIDPFRCFGCGVCRAGCSKDAISLTDRASNALVARSW